MEMIINPFDYFYYKIYCAWRWLGGGEYPFRHRVAIWLLYFLNYVTICGLMFGKSATLRYSAAIAISIGVIMFIFYNLKREKRILLKYRRESETSRQIGNAAVILYVIITIVSFVLVVRLLMTS